MVQTPESAIEAVLNPSDLRASRGQAMVQFAANRWFKAQNLTLELHVPRQSVMGGSDRYNFRPRTDQKLISW
jgi:hypothetical protein